MDSGKTTWCRRNLVDREGNSCDGLLLPRVYESGRRVGYDALRISTRLAVPFARIEGFEPPEWVPAERIGPFSIDREARRTANRWIRESCLEDIPGLVIDEVGPLEIQGGGLEAGLRFALDRWGPDKELYLVVRSGLVDKVAGKFYIRNFRLVEV
ncbi:hypothetical protein ES703_58613 [subsurface metagenome]